MREVSWLDRILTECNHFLSVQQSPPADVSPADACPEAPLNAEQKEKVIALMRVNHTGEICAQALYRAEAMLAKDKAVQAHLQQAAEEEKAHLAWCQKRLNELQGRPSLLNPLWYWGSFAIGLMAAKKEDGANLGFVEETEKQVSVHLDEHLQALPANDQKSQAILKKMREEEQAHAGRAKDMGAKALPLWVTTMMRLQAKVMKAVAYRI